MEQCGVSQESLWIQFGKAKSMGWQIKQKDLPRNISGNFFPNKEDIFKSLELISPGEVKYIIVGQDPYFNAHNGVPLATGVAFAVNKSCNKIPHSLARIMKKVYGESCTRNPELTDWIKERKILLLNAALTVPAGNDPKNAGVHLRDGMWNNLLREVITQVRQVNPNVPIIAWGKATKCHLENALGKSPSILWSYHPRATNKGKHSFDQFWEETIGFQLRL